MAHINSIGTSYHYISSSCLFSFSFISKSSHILQFFISNVFACCRFICATFATHLLVNRVRVTHKEDLADKQKSFLFLMQQAKEKKIRYKLMLNEIHFEIHLQTDNVIGWQINNERAGNKERTHFATHLWSIVLKIQMMLMVRDASVLNQKKKGRAHSTRMCI